MADSPFARTFVEAEEENKQNMTMYHNASSDPDSSEGSEEWSGDYGIVYGIYKPYQNEPLVRLNSEGGEQRRPGNEIIDTDGLTYAKIPARYEGEVSVNDWCKC